MATTSNSSTIDLADGQSLTVTGNLYNGGAIDLDAGVLDIGGSGLAVTGTLINSGTLTIGNARIGTPDTVTVGNLINNSGSIGLTGSGPSAEATLNVAAAAPNMLRGTISLSGYSVLNYGSGGVRSIGGGASLTLDGPNAQLSVTGGSGNESALAALTVNLGAFSLDDGASVSVRAFNNLGDLDLDAGGSRFIDTGLLLNSGGLTIGNAGLTTPDTVTVGGVAINTGAISLNGGGNLSVAVTLLNNGSLTVAASDTVTAGAGVINGGAISLNGGTSAKSEAILDATAGWAPTMLTGSITLSGYAQLKIGGAGFKSIASGATFTLIGNSNIQPIWIPSAPSNHDGLLLLSVNAGTINLDEGAALFPAYNFNNLGHIDIDNRPTFANGYGSGGLSVGYLLNSGSISAAEAGFYVSRILTNSGSISLIDNTYFSVAEMLFNSGQITTGPSIANTDGLRGAVVLTALSNTGSISIAAGDLMLVQSTATNNGTIATTDSNTTIQGALSGSGTVTIDGGTVAVGAVASTQTVEFTGSSGGELILNQPGSFAGTIAGFAAGDTINLTGIAAASAQIEAGDKLVLTDAANLTLATLQMTGDFTGDMFQITPDGNGGSVVSVAPRTAALRHTTLFGQYIAAGFDLAPGHAAGVALTHAAPDSSPLDLHAGHKAG
jgi:hypothetical protein